MTLNSVFINSSLCWGMGGKGRHVNFIGGPFFSSSSSFPFTFWEMFELLCFIFLRYFYDYLFIWAMNTSLPHISLKKKWMNCSYWCSFCISFSCIFWQVYSSTDVRTSLSHDANRFAVLNKDFRLLMRATEKNPNVLQRCTRKSNPHFIIITIIT